MRHPVVAEDLVEIAQRSPFLRQLEGHTVLVAGASGFLPAYMVEAMLAWNERGTGDAIRVTAVVRNAARAKQRFAAYRGRKDLRLVTQDISSLSTVAGPVDFIVHAASQASPKYFGTDPVGTLLPNVLGTHRLLELARKKDAKALLFFSSGEVYGRLPPEDVPCKETTLGKVDPLDVRSCYGESKRMGENMCASWFAQHGVRTKVVRPFHTYGPGMVLDDGRIFADFVANIVAGKNLVIKSDGKAVRAYCYLADATTGYFHVLLQGKPGEAYNVGNMAAAVSVAELAQRLVRLFPEKRLQVQFEKRPETSAYLPSVIPRAVPDTAKLEALGWSARHSIESGFARTVRTFEHPQPPATAARQAPAKSAILKRRRKLER